MSLLSGFLPKILPIGSVIVGIIHNISKCYIKCSDLERGKAYENVGIDTISKRDHRTDRNTLDERLRANKCELCGAEGEGISFEIHHVNKVKDLKGKELWKQAMIAKKRKTLVVCHECHVKIHYHSS